MWWVSGCVGIGGEWMWGVSGCVGSELMCGG